LARLLLKRTRERQEHIQYFIAKILYQERYQLSISQRDKSPCLFWEFSLIKRCVGNAQVWIDPIHGKKVEHLGVKIELVGQIGKNIWYLFLLLGL
jgi:hypothetical protein